MQESNRQREMRETLATGDQLLAQGDFSGSLKAFQRILTAAQDKPPADVATYNMGLVYAHPQNPERNLQKAVRSFDQVARLYPDSPWAEQAKIWVGVLNETEESKHDVETTRQDIEKWKQEVERNRVAIEKSKQEADKSRLELEKTKQEIEKSKQVIEKSKQVDIEIDQKRRDRGR